MDLAAALSSMPHGGDLDLLAHILGCAPHDILDFSANVNPLGMRTELEDALHQAIPELTRYQAPYPRDLSKALAEKLGLFESELVLGNGAADLILRLALALKDFVEEPKLLLPVPNFNEYPRAFDAAGWAIDYWVWPEEERLTDRGVDLMLDQLKEAHRALLLCQPNNPTGELYSLQALGKILDMVKERRLFLIMDECFFDFLDPKDAVARDLMTRAADLELGDLLISFHSFTKFYAMPGLRLGYLTSKNRDLIARMKDLTPPWPINHLAEVAGLCALRIPEQDKAIVRREIASAKAALKEGLRELGCEQISGEANFVHFRHKDSELALKLLQQTPPIYIRSLSNVKGLDSHDYRVAVKSPADNQKLLAGIRQAQNS